VETERGHDKFTVADLVRDDAANDDAEAKTGEPCPVYKADLKSRKAELGSPDFENPAANRQADARSQYGGEPGPKEPLGIRCDGFIAYFDIVHRYVVFWGYYRL